MNQKFSQLNRDYAKKMSSRDHVLVKNSKGRGLLWVLIGFLGIVILLAGFFMLKKTVIKSITPVLPETPKSLTAKQPKVKALAYANQEYDFYKMLPNMEVKSAFHAEETEKK